MHGIPPNIFDYIKLSKHAREVWLTLDSMFKGNELVIDDMLSYVINKFNIFQRISGETLMEACNQFIPILNKLSSHDIVKGKLETNIQFMNELVDKWITIKMSIQGNGSPKKMDSAYLFCNLQEQ